MTTSKKNYKLLSRLQNAEKISTALFAKAGFGKGKWVRKQEILSIQNVLSEKHVELCEKLPKHIVGAYFEKEPTFRTIMTLLRNIARYAEVAIIRRKVNKKIADKWKTTYYYKLCT